MSNNPMKPDGWYSRRNQTSEAQFAAREVYQLTRGRRSRQASGKAVKSLRESRTPKQQIKALDERLGKGIGATRERARLQKIIDSNSKKG